MTKVKFLAVMVIAALLGVVFSFSAVINSVSAVTVSVDPFSANTAKSMILVHASSGKMLYGKNEHQKVQVASITKLMTTLLTLEQIENDCLSLDDQLVVSQHAASMEGSQAFLDAGNAYSVRDLLKTVIVASANDSAVVLAEAISGSEDEFAIKMNERAAQLGMKNSHYTNSTGLPSTEQFSTAYDTTIILNELGKYALFNEDSQIWMDNLIHKSGRETELVNTNRLIKYYPNTLNGKTGYTLEAGYCLSSTAQRSGLRLIAVVLNTSTASARFSESMQLYNWGFANFENKQVVKAQENLPLTAKVAGGEVENINLTAQDSYYLINKKGQTGVVELKYEINKKISAPIKAGDVVGKILVLENGKVVGQVNILAKESVEKLNYAKSIRKSFENWKLTK